jgi:SOS-response transcriptional repressor LexA
MANVKQGIICKRKLWILWCIDQYVRDCGRSPTIREIISALGLTEDGESAVYHHMNAMFNEGWIASEIMAVSNKRRAGTTRLTALGRSQLELPATQALLAQQPFYQARTAVRAPVVQAEPRRQQPRAHAASYVVLAARITSREPQVVHIPVLSLIAASFGAEMPSSDYSLPSLGPEEKIAIQEEMLPRGCNVKNCTRWKCAAIRWSAPASRAAITSSSNPPKPPRTATCAYCGLTSAKPQ